MSGSAGPRHILGRAPCPPQGLLAARHTAMGGQPRRWWRLGQGPGGSRGHRPPQVSLLPEGTWSGRRPEPACTHTMEGAPGAQTALSPAVPATSLSLGVSGTALCGCLRGPSCPPARVPSPLLLSGAHVLSAPFHPFGGAPSHSQVETFKPSPHSHPSAVPPHRPCKWGPHVRCGRMSWPGLPRAAPGSCLGAERPRWRELCASPRGNRRLPPAWETPGRPPRRRVGLGRRCCCGVLGQAGSGGWGLGKRHGLERPQLGGLTLAPVKSDLVSPAPTCRLKDTCLPGTSQKAHI